MNESAGSPGAPVAAPGVPLDRRGSRETAEAFADDESQRSPLEEVDAGRRRSFDKGDESDPELARRRQASQISEWRHLNHLRRAARLRRRKKDQSGLSSGDDALSLGRRRAKGRKPRSRAVAAVGLGGTAGIPYGHGQGRKGYGQERALAELGSRPMVLEMPGRSLSGGPVLVDPDVTHGPQLLSAEDFRDMRVEDGPSSPPSGTSDPLDFHGNKTRVAVYCVANALDIQRLFAALTGRRLQSLSRRDRRYNWLVNRDVSWEDEMVENGASHGDVLHSYTRVVTAYETDSDANSGTQGLPTLARGPNGSVNASPSRGAHPYSSQPPFEWKTRDGGAKLHPVPEATAYGSLTNWVAQAMGQARPARQEQQRLLGDEDRSYGGAGDDSFLRRVPEERAQEAREVPERSRRNGTYNGPRRSVHAYRHGNAPRAPARSQVSYQTDTSSALESLGRDVFFFPYGGVVFWGFQEREEQLVLNFLGSYTRKEVSEEEFVQSSDNFDVMVGDKSGVFADIISIATDDAAERMAVSFALAQSASLFVFEVRVEQAIEVTKPLPEEMASTGRISMSESRINKMIGTIFVMRTQINLHSDILDTPEYFWEADYWEPLYKSVIDYMDLPERVALLNSRLDILKELMDVLATQNTDRHASKLEWIIIWLIVIEVLLQGLDLVIRFFDGHM